METLYILWIVLLVVKMQANGDVYHKQGKEELYQGDFSLGGYSLGGTILVIFTFWWSKEDMLENPDQKKDMIQANVSNVLFFLLTAVIVTAWIIIVVKRYQTH